MFRHPLAGIQLPAGTVELDEDPISAARREVSEETGLQGLIDPASLGTTRTVLSPGSGILLRSQFLWTGPRPPSAPSGDTLQPTFALSGDTPRPTFASSGDTPRPTFASSGDTPQPTFASSGDNPATAVARAATTPRPAFASSGDTPQPTFASSGDIPRPTFASSGGTPRPTFASSGNKVSRGLTVEVLEVADDGQARIRHDVLDFGLTPPALVSRREGWVAVDELGSVVVRHYVHLRHDGGGSSRWTQLADGYEFAPFWTPLHPPPELRAAQMDWLAFVYEGLRRRHRST